MLSRRSFHMLRVSADGCSSGWFGARGELDMLQLERLCCVGAHVCLVPNFTYDFHHPVKTIEPFLLSETLSHFTNFNRWKAAGTPRKSQLFFPPVI